MAEQESLMDMLCVSGLYKSFGDKKVLQGLDLAVPQNSIFGFIGKNGAGKTTTMKTVLGLIMPDAGDIWVNGERVTYGETATNRYIGYLPDVPEFYPFMTAFEYLCFSGEICGMERAKYIKRGGELLELVGLDKENGRIRGYSRGMKQRLGIAQALLGNPRLLICDEPTSALDPVGRKEILDTLLSIKEQTTVLFSTHILSDVERICTDVAFLNNGTVAVNGKLSEVKARYGSDEYLVQTRNTADTDILMRTFPEMKITEKGSLIFKEREHTLFDLMRFAADKRIPIDKMEKSEPTLETLFMEVTGK